MSSGSDDYDSRTGLDVNASSSSQRGAAYVCGCKINAFFVAGNKSATNLTKISILHLILLLCPSTEGFEGFIAEQRDERHGAFFDMVL